MKFPSSLPSGLGFVIFAIIAIVAGLCAVSADRTFVAVKQWENSSPQFGGAAPANWPAEALAIKDFARRSIQDFDACLYVISLSLALIAFRPHRNRRNRRYGPGHVALAASGGIITYSLVYYLWFVHGDPKLTGFKPFLMAGMPHTFWSHLPYGHGLSIAICIVAAWVYVLAIEGWRRPKEPLERVGRWVGWSWIGSSIIARIIEALH